MKRLSLFVCVLILAVAAVGQEKPILPLSVAGLTGEGVFHLYKNDTNIGTITYALTPDGHYTRSFTIAMAGQSVKLDYTIDFDAKGYWKSMKITAPSETVDVVREGARATYKLEKKGTSFSTELTPDHVIYDNYSPIFESLMLRHYDRKKGGEQTFSCYLVPSKTIDGTLEFTGEKSHTVKEKMETFETYTFTLAGIPVEIWTDETGKIYYMNVPVQYAAFVREGWEDLMKKEAAGVISRPDYEVTRKIVMIPMRDGVKLATDLYVPKGKTEKKRPVILIRTPYKKEMQELDGNFWGKRGYVTAVQDCRGRFSSEGVWEPFIHEADDGYDTIEYLGTQPWSTGKVGMIGGSYVGWVQLWAAAARPPHLTTIIPNVAPPDPFYNIPYEYGAFFILGSIWWAEILESEATGDLSGKAMAKIGERKYEKILKKLPVIDLDEEIFGKKNPYWRKWIMHDTDDDYWRPADFRDKLGDVTIPVFLQSGWFDGDGIGSKLNYRLLKDGECPTVKLVLGPWGHTTESSSRLGNYDFGPQAALDLQTLYVRWFDHYLKGMKNGILDEPLVQIFAMFSNKWLTGDSYPLMETNWTNLYLTSRKGANTSRGDGRLAFDSPTTGKPYDRYTYNPGDPTPWPEYNYRSDKEIRKEKKKTRDVEEIREQAKAFHRSVTDKRKDILVYTTDPLDKPLTIAGPVSAILYASTNAPDTDWFITLNDVDEKGEILMLVKGVIRAKFRNGVRKPELLEKNRIYEYTIDLWQTGITFEKGHRIMVEVSSALFPAFSRNLNTGGHNEREVKFRKAKQKVYHTKEYPSHIVLPVIEIQ